MPDNKILRVGKIIADIEPDGSRAIFHTTWLDGRKIHTEMSLSDVAAAIARMRAIDVTMRQRLSEQLDHGEAAIISAKATALPASDVVFLEDQGDLVLLFLLKDRPPLAIRLGGLEHKRLLERLIHHVRSRAHSVAWLAILSQI